VKKKCNSIGCIKFAVRVTIIGHADDVVFYTDKKCDFKTHTFSTEYWDLYSLQKGSNGVAKDVKPKCQHETVFDAGFGSCKNYFNYLNGNTNHKHYCSTNYDSVLGLYASEACPQCGSCRRNTDKKCSKRTEFQNKRGEGCNTYALGLQNHLFCNYDYDNNTKTFAFESCQECDKCHY